MKRNIIIVFAFVIGLAIVRSDGQTILPNGQGGASSSSSSGGGATSLSAITDWAVTRTSGTVMTINAAATVSAPVNGRIGSVSYSFTSPGTASLSGTACTGTVFVYVASGGANTWGHNGLTCTFTPGGTVPPTIAPAVTGFPVDSIPLWQLTITAGAWDTVTGTMDKRAAFSAAPIFAAGSNITLTPSGSTLTIAASGGGASPLATNGQGSIWLTSRPANIGAGNTIGTTLNFLQITPDVSMTLGKLAVFTSAGASGQFGCFCLYDSADAFLAKTTNEDLTAGASIRTFTFSSPPTITANTVYTIGWAASGTATWSIFGNASSGAEGNMLNALNDTTALRRFYTTGQTLTSPGASQTCPATITGSRTALNYNVPNVVVAP